MSMESKSVLDPLLESASDEVLRLAADTIFKQLLRPNSPINQQIEQMGRPSGPERRLENLQNLLSSMGGFKHERATPEMLALANLSAAVEGSPVFEDNTPQDFGVTPGFLATLLRTHAAGGDTDTLITKYLRTGEGTAVNPGRYAPPERQTRLFEGQAQINLPGLNADIRMRTTGQNAPERLLPRDIATQLQLETGARAVNDLLAGQMLDIGEAAEAVQRDQDAKIVRAEGLLAQIRAGIPNLVAQFKDALGTRHQRIETVTDDRRAVETTRNLRDGKHVDTRTVTTRRTDETDINGPAQPGVFQLPSAAITIEPSRISRYVGAGFAMGENNEAALVEPRVGPDFAEVTAHGHVALATASGTFVESGGIIIKEGGGSMKIGG